MKKRYNIAIVIESVTAKAGIERSVTNLANMLNEDDHRVSIISLYSKNNAASHYKIDKGVSIIHLGLKRGNWIWRYISYVQFIIVGKLLIKEQNFDYIIGTTHAFNCILTFFNKKSKKIGCEHFNYESCSESSKRLRKKYYPRLDAIVLLTEADSKRYSFIKKEKVFVIPNASSFSCNQPSTVDNNRIIAAGRLTYQKGFDMLLEAAVEMKKQLPNWKLEIFGDGSDKEQLLKQIEELEIEDFVKVQPNTLNVKRELLKSSIYVMSSRFEGLPMILIEAQTCGLPIVSFDCPQGPNEIISNGENGYLVENGNIDALAERVIELAKDNEKRKEYGINAYQASRRFKCDKILSKWNRLFETLDEKVQ